MNGLKQTLKICCAEAPAKQNRAERRNTIQLPLSRIDEYSVKPTDPIDNNIDLYFNGWVGGASRLLKIISCLVIILELILLLEFTIGCLGYGSSMRLFFSCWTGRICATPDLIWRRLGIGTSEWNTLWNSLLRIAVTGHILFVILLLMAPSEAKESQKGESQNGESQKEESQRGESQISEQKYSRNRCENVEVIEKGKNLIDPMIPPLYLSDVGSGDECDENVNPDKVDQMTTEDKINDQIFDKSNTKFNESFNTTRLRTPRSYLSRSSLGEDKNNMSKFNMSKFPKRRSEMSQIGVFRLNQTSPDLLNSQSKLSNDRLGGSSVRRSTKSARNAD